ncbi:hypothetical protein C1J01_16320 [Nonomuraea aridisoli]|uniref:SAM-dependent methyltransferase n=2 Tax=Nonomuraea aridisoli TaxID=2070368 RepID=A0A2W2E650_9ACTN|nr:hypothetical protein C1J01_16320 [Nonomuraea aridisoli]
MYDYLLGGTNNYAVDRAAAAEGMKYDPDIRAVAVANRSFLKRAVRYVAEQGITQFLDVGTGLPTEENVHEIAQSVAPNARTVYVDNDPNVLPLAQALIVGDEQTRYIEADLRDPHGILTHPVTVRHLDHSQPWCLVLCSVLHFVPDADDAYGVVYRLMDAMPPGSYMIFTHASSTDIDPRLQEIVTRTNARLRVPITYRPIEDIARFLDHPGWEMVQPGLVDVQRWQPEKVSDDDATSYTIRVMAGVAVRR